MKNLNYFFLFGLLAFVLAGCDKDDDTPKLVPTITTISPAEVFAGDSITISGTNFINVTSVSIGATDVAFVMNGEAIKTMVPANSAEGSVEVTVVTPDGSVKKSFTVLSTAPVIASFTQTEGVTGDNIEIVGTFLNDITSIMLGEVAVTKFEETEDGDAVTFLIPAGAETGKITIVTAKGEVVSTEDFVVNPALILYRNGETPTWWTSSMYSWGDPVIVTDNTEKVAPGATHSLKVTIGMWLGFGWNLDGVDLSSYSSLKVNLQSPQVGKMSFTILGPESGEVNAEGNPIRYSVSKNIEWTAANVWTKIELADIITEYIDAHGNTIEAIQFQNLDSDKVIYFDYILFQ